MPRFRPFALLAALIGLTTVAPATAADVARVANTARLSYDTAGGRATVASNTVTLDVDRAKAATRLSFRLPPVGYGMSGMRCDTTSGATQFTPAPIDAATLAGSAPLVALDANQPLIVVLDNPGGNRDPAVRETAWVNVTAAGFTGRVPLLETGPDTGVFAGGVPESGRPGFAACDLTAERGERLRVTFSEDAYSLGSEAAILVDPAGYVFDSQTGALIDGARVTLLDAADQPATVFGDDGASRFPATVTSGGSVTDASGRTYRFAPGNYRFPRVASGQYHLRIEPPAGYAAPSTRPAADLARLRDPGGKPFQITPASFGKPFALAAPDPFYTDIPLDRAGDTALVLTKTASVREAQPGDFVQYRVTLTNRGTGAASNVTLTDILPVGLRIERGSTRGAGEPAVSTDGRNLTFQVPAVAAGGAVDLTYVVSVAPGAPTGEAVNRVLASGAGGATSNEASAAVRIAPLLFTDGVTLIGRVTEGGCGDPGRGRRGIAGIRLMLEDGTYVVTDDGGYYHIEGMRPGRHVVQLDTGSIPASYEPVACDRDTRTGGSAISRFVEAEGGLLKRVDFQLRPTGKAAAPIDALPITPASDADAAGNRDWFAGQEPGVALLFPTADYNPRAPVTRIIVKHLPGQRVALSINGAPVDPIAFDATDTNDAKTIALSRWTGIPLREGDNVIEARVLDARGAPVATLTRTVHSASIATRATFVPPMSRLVADGLTRPLVAVRVTDRDGRPVRAGTLVSFRVEAPYGAAIDVALDQRRQLTGAASVRTTARVVGDEGLAFIALQPTTQSGEVRIAVTLADEQASRTSDIRARLAPAAKDWIVVGFGAGTIGYDTLRSRTSALPRGTDGGAFIDGQLAFYAKGRIKGSWLLTLSFDSDRKRDRSRGLLGTIDPDRYYTVYGDGSLQAYDAPTGGKLYLRLERRNFYALFGDFETGLNDAQLTRYSRTLDGVKLDYQGNVVSVTAFAANTDQRYARDEIRGNGLSGPYRLSGRDIVPNSDKLRIEVRDRLRPDLIVRATPMTRNVDYDIDPAAGTIRFREPVLGRDAELDPVFIVVDYETYGADRRKVGGARVAAKLAGGKVQLGATVLRDESAGSAAVAGVDVRVKPAPATELRGEVAIGGRFGLGTGRAWLVEAEHHDKAIDLIAYARSQDSRFGLGQQSVVEAGTRRFGIDGRIAIADRLSLSVTAWHASQLDGPGTRTAADVRLEYRRANGTMFVGGQFADDRGIDGQARSSRLLTIGGSQTLFKGDLTLSGQAQVAPGGERSSVDFPTRQQLMATWRVRDGVRLLAGYEIAGGADYTARTARIGFDLAPWKGARLMSTLNRQGVSATGARTYAEYGMSQSLPLGRHWSIDATLDASATLSGRIPNGAFVTAFSTAIGGTGSNAGGYGSDGDYVAVTGGAAYRAGRWSWNGRAEYRRSDANTRWGLTTDALRALGEGQTIAASVRYYDLADRKGARARSLSADVALALRPADSRWSLLDRLQLRRQAADAGFGGGNVLGVPAYGNGFQATTRLINNLAVNYRSGDEGSGHAFEATAYYGAKWVRGSFGGDDYAGFIQAIGIELRQDLGPRFDIGVQGSVQHAWSRGAVAFSAGPSVGMSPGGNAWVTLGYNAAGYRDRDFENDRYTRAGPYATLRLKFDQLSLGGLGRGIFGAGR